MIEEDYVSFETAKLLKEKGFDEDIDLWYDEDGGMFFKHRYDIITDYRVKHNQEVYQCPSLQMAVKWLRTIYNIDIEIPAEVGILGTKVYVPMISTYKNRKNAPEKLTQLKFGLYYKDDKGGVPALKYYKTKEEACEAAIKYCLENLI